MRWQKNRKTPWIDSHYGQDYGRKKMLANRGHDYTKVFSLETGPSLVDTINKRAIADDQEKMLRFHGKDHGCHGYF